MRERSLFKAGLGAEEKISIEDHAKMLTQSFLKQKNIKLN